MRFFCSLVVAIFLKILVHFAHGAKTTEKTRRNVTNETISEGELDKARLALIESLKNHILRKLGINATVIPGNDTDTPAVADPNQVIPKNLFQADQPSIRKKSRSTFLTFVEPTCNENPRAGFALPLHYDLSNIPKQSIRSVLLHFKKLKLTNNNTRIFCPEIVNNFDLNEKQEKLRFNIYHITGLTSDGKAKRELIDSRLDTFDNEKNIAVDLSNYMFMQLGQTTKFDIVLEFQDLFGRYIHITKVIKGQSCKNSTCSNTLECGVNLQVWIYTTPTSSKRSKRSDSVAENPEDCSFSDSCCLRSLNLNLEGDKFSHMSEDL